MLSAPTPFPERMIFPSSMAFLVASLLDSSRNIKLSVSSQSLPSNIFSPSMLVVPLAL